VLASAISASAWQAGGRAIFKDELGAHYVACHLLDPPREPIHTVALALKAREVSG
jgi:hypothetical protein